MKEKGGNEQRNQGVIERMSQGVNEWMNQGRKGKYRGEGSLFYYQPIDFVVAII